ncbi:unnamed protein product [Acanthoscelides obtectus]|uniref:Uncharacterized protein n=1 Tax=Acanthoscelides obtectus TaxID=200917 RepID=A0A9P0K1I3_ACAOB|nr:unnamed protein product [Acanthoscelides obtectus]CAK1649365.1 hypothetical protein AOBTE_LOCUS16186 [Acanthoscelides obtectus]
MASRQSVRVISQEWTQKKLHFFYGFILLYLIETEVAFFFKLYGDLRKYPEKFFNYTRISIASFDELLNLCRNDLTKQDTIFRKSISAEEKLFVSLRMFTHGTLLQLQTRSYNNLHNN